MRRDKDDDRARHGYCRHACLPHGAVDKFEALRDQAQLQLGRVDRPWHLLPPEAERGFGLLPKPSATDLFSTWKAIPSSSLKAASNSIRDLVRRRRLRNDLGARSSSEQAAFEQLVDLIHTRLQVDPSLHVYHYAAYERTALKLARGVRDARGASRRTSASRSSSITRWFARALYGAGVPSYSIKELESLYGFVRRAELRSETIQWSVR